jgi:hypothetical protein
LQAWFKNSIGRAVAALVVAATFAGVSLDAANPTAQTLFPDTKTGNDSGAEGNFYELGTVFRATVSGTVTHLRVFSLASESGAHTVRLWRNYDNTVVAGPLTVNYGGFTGWTNLDIPDVPILPDVDYTVVITTGGGGRNYPFIAGDLATPGGNGQNLVHPANAGVFSTTAGARPTQTFQGANYCRDVVFAAGNTPLPTNGPVLISEFMAENQSSLSDEDGDFSDWIELYNPAATPVSLAGWQLLDGTNVWTFPAKTIAAQGFLVVFASGKNRTNPAATLHTNFKLDASGEYLALRDAGSNLLSQFAPLFPPQRADYSSGPGTNGVTVVFFTPTPGAANSLSFGGFVKDIAFNLKRGFFTNVIQVFITNATPGAEVRYTLNGATPTESSALLTNSLTISNTATLRARAFKPGWMSTKIHTGTYLFLADVLQQTAAGALAYGWPAGPVSGQVLRYGLNSNLVAQYSPARMTAALRQLPTLSIVTDQGNLTDPATGIYVNGQADGTAWERPVSLELLNPDGSDGFQEDCGLRIRGGQSRNGTFPKHSFHVNFRAEYGARKLNFPLFGSAGAKEFDTFDLRCEHGYAYADPHQYGSEFTAVRDVFCRDLWGTAGFATTRSGNFHLYINGQYWGLYQSQERPDESYGSTYLGGSKTDYDFIKATGLPQLSIEVSNGDITNWTRLWSGARAVATNAASSNYFALLGRHPDGSTNTFLPVLLDPRELAAYMLLHYYCGHSDEPLSVSFGFEKPNNFRALRRRSSSSPFRFFVHDGESSVRAPEWVDNRANAVNLVSPNRTDLNYSNPEWMHEDLLTSPEYRIAFADEAQRLLFNDGAFTAAKAQPVFDARAAQISEAVIGESIRWGQGTGDNQTTWSNKIVEIRSLFFPTRTAVVVAQLRQRNLFPSINAPAFSQRGGQVAVGYSLVLTATNGAAIYFTTNGTDPRAIGGAPAGIAYAGPTAIQSPTLVRARCRTAGGEWSALDEASFTTFAPATAAHLVVSELHFHPAPPTPAEQLLGFADESAFEFVELLNISPEGRDLTGVRFTQGVSFGFSNAPVAARFLPPGGRMVVVGNQAGFLSRLTGPPPLIAGVFSGSLKNSGETLALVDASNVVIKSFTYGDAAPWSRDADGNGRSLVLNNPFTNPDHTLPWNWRPSPQSNGAPGSVDSAPLPVSPAADDDGNHRSNLYDHAVGDQSPFTLSAEAYAPPVGVATNYWYFRHPRSLAADGFRWRIEASSNLTTWTTGTVSYVSTKVTTGSQAVVTYRTTNAAWQLSPAFFIRLSVEP